jgi:hypothetical protein
VVVGGVTSEIPSGSYGPNGFELTPTCALVSVRGETPVVHGWRITGAQRFVMANGQVESEVTEVGDSQEVHVTWTAEGIGVIADVLRLLAPDVKAQFSTGRSPGRDAVVAVRGQREPADGTHVGYAAVRMVEVRFTGACSDGTTTSGTLTSWTGSEIDIVGCPGAPGDRVTEAGRLAQEEHCVD